MYCIIYYFMLFYYGILYLILHFVLFYFISTRSYSQLYSFYLFALFCPSLTFFQYNFLLCFPRLRFIFWINLRVADTLLSSTITGNLKCHSGLYWLVVYCCIYLSCTSLCLFHCFVSYFIVLNRICILSLRSPYFSLTFPLIFFSDLNFSFAQLMSLALACCLNP